MRLKYACPRVMQFPWFRHRPDRSKFLLPCWVRSCDFPVQYHPCRSRDVIRLAVMSGQPRAMSAVSMLALVKQSEWQTHFDAQLCALCKQGLAYVLEQAPHDIPLPALHGWLASGFLRTLMFASHWLRIRPAPYHGPSFWVQHHSKVCALVACWIGANPVDDLFLVDECPCCNILHGNAST